MFKKYIILLGFLFAFFASFEVTNAQMVSENEKFSTTEDIIADILFPTIDKKVIKEYGGDIQFNWHWDSILSIRYNPNHSYDVAAKITIDNHKKDLVRVRISPPCNSEKLNKKLCDHGFKIEILEYKHLIK